MNEFVVTLAPPSLHTCAAAHSRGILSCPGPLPQHTLESSWRPHRQVREDRGEGKWRRRHRMTLKS